MIGYAGAASEGGWAPGLRRALGAAPPLDPPTFRRQETVQILLNLVVLAGLMSLHALFRPVVGRLTPEAAVAFSLRFLMQVGEAALLARSGSWLTPRRTWWYARLSIAANVAFTAVVSRLSAGQESHYAVLMVIPVIAAAFRLSRAGLVATLALVVGITVAQVWVPVGPFAPAASLGETFEATTVALIFVVVAVIVRLLGAQLWRKETDLQQSLRDLAAARDRLVGEEKLAAVGRLASAVAHEIRNPVSMIASAVATAQSAGTAPEVRGEVFDIVVQETKRLQRLTEDFLTYARPRPPQRRPTSLGEAVGLTEGLARARAAELGLTLEAAAADLELALDPFQIQQALLNLVMNAMQATPPGGRVRLAAAPADGGAVFWVEDSGPAIPGEIVARLAEPFVTSKPGGTGLGLAIARGIARAHGGDLALACNEPGRVRFELRVAGVAGGGS